MGVDLRLRAVVSRRQPLGKIRELSGGLEHAAVEQRAQHKTGEQHQQHGAQHFQRRASRQLPQVKHGMTSSLRARMEGQAQHRSQSCDGHSNQKPYCRTQPSFHVHPPSLNLLCSASAFLSDLLTRLKSPAREKL